MLGSTTPAPAAIAPAETLPLITDFLTSIGLRIEYGEVPDDTFLPAVQVIQNGLRVDRAKLKHPGDLLHEGGHLAAMSRAEREQPVPIVSPDGGDEMLAIAWSYAAAVHLGLPPEVVFHADGYRGGSESLVENFTAGRPLGVPMLQYRGLSYESRLAAEHGVPAYPHMVRWLRE